MPQERIAFLSDVEVSNPRYDIVDDLSEMENLIAYTTSSNLDTMYYHQAMKQPYKKELQRSIQEEMNNHTSRKHWKLVAYSKVSQGTCILGSVWTLKRKREIKSQEVYKWKIA